jgi:peptidoglycan/xylan/chitin deacetylase (PgdA/CDA1 family)
MKWLRRFARHGSYDPAAGLPFDPDELESRLVWIWASARSGSTWFLRLLSHPLKIADSRDDPDDYLGFQAPPTWQGTVDAIPVDTTFLANHLVPVSGRGYTDAGEPATFSAALGLPNRANYFFSNKYADVWRPELRRLMLVRFQRFVERAGERYTTADPRILIKEVAGAQAAHLIMSLFPNSKMIFLIRDGRDVVDSQTAANQPGGWLPHNAWETEEERLEFVRDRARAWVGDMTMIRRAFEAHPPELRRRIRYEDVLADQTSIGPLMEWAGLERNDVWLERAIEVNSFSRIPDSAKGSTKFYRSASPGAWRENLSEGEQAAMHEIMGPKLLELGYQLDEEARGAGESAPGVWPDPAKKGSVLGGGLNSAREGRDFTGVDQLVLKRGGPATRPDRLVALTFDDGPVPRTRKALDALEQHDARGTFFLVGRKLPGQEGLVREILARGHEIGNHSFGHMAYPPADDLRANSAVLEHLTGSRPALFRPPFGAIDRPSADAAADLGMRSVLWSADSHDAVPVWAGASIEEIVTNIERTIGPGGIVLLHDGLSWSRAVEALPALLVTLTGAGFRMVTVGELLARQEAADSRPGGVAARLAAAFGGRRRRKASAEAGQPGETVDDPTTQLVDTMDRSADRSVGAPLSDPLAEGLRTALDPILEAGSFEGTLLARGTAAFESNAFYPVALGFALRLAERTLGEAGHLPEEFIGHLNEPESDDEPAIKVARRIAAPRAFGPDADAARHAGDENEAEAFAADVDFDDPGPVFDSVFLPGQAAWRELQVWATGVAADSARRRMSDLLAAAGVGDAVDVQPQVERISYPYALRFGYALAVCDEHLGEAAA